jgi:lipopolysaccharide transport protein LptA
MAISNAKFLVLLVLTLPALRAHCAVHAAAAQPITLDAQSADYSPSNIVFRKVRITQGNMSIYADQGQGQGQGTKESTQLNFDNSLWLFRGNVKITLDVGELTSDDAQINFDKQLLSKAVVNGKPAAFEQRIAKTGKVAQGHADTIDYDAVRGIIHLTKNGWLSDGQYEVKGDSLKYNVAAQTIVAEGSDQESRVHIIVTPPPSKP